MLNNMKMVDKEMKSAKESHYKESQELYRLRAEEALSDGRFKAFPKCVWMAFKGFYMVFNLF